MIIGSGIALFYYLRIILSLFGAKTVISMELENKENVSRTAGSNLGLNIMMKTGLVILLCLSFFFGIYPELITTTINAL